ncbi:ATP-grasp fold amidoligase family protein [Sphingomonas kaistensis]|uniref:ATP-grasp fold amidoligase family protein n=1 Tax=Sphingomonas kaistensis TaxID=298708 RepID=A0ABZ2G0I9_9SPHN
MTLFTRAANHAAIAPMFAQKFGRQPLPSTDPEATINDLIFARMIDPEWTALERRLVDKITAKEEAARLCPDLRVAATLATIDMAGVASPADLFDRLRGFIGTDAIAKPSQASGGTVFLRHVAGPADLAALHALATTDYAAVMREMQYAGLPRRVIVEALIPTADGLPPDDYKFHCINGEPLLCQIDHARFGSPWGRIFRMPDFEPMDGDDGLDWPDSLQRPALQQIAAMIAAARTLSKPFDYVRVDLYNGLDGIYFGELTFTPSASLGIAPSKHGSHRVSPTHRLFSRILMDALNTNAR